MPADRVVSVVAGFGLWDGTRHVVSARWIDVLRISAFLADEAPAGRVSLVLALENGAEVEVHEALTGFSSFLDAAETALPALPRRDEWRAALADLEFPTTCAMLFDRAAARR